MQLQPDTIFARDYRIVSAISAGGMGTVYRALQLSTGKARALKLMHGTFLRDAESRRRFEQEARVGSRIASEHVVEVQAAGVDDETRMPYLVMELLEGEDLAHRLARGPMPLAEAAIVLDQIAHALAAAHDAHVVHRDVKPANIFLAVSRRSGVTTVVKLLDFGIAKVVEEGQRGTTGAYGTPLWWAPEQTRRGVVTPATDVWALGLVAFTLLTGKVFWRAAHAQAPSASDLLREILDAPIPQASFRARELGASVPAGFDAWLSHCLARDPAARYPNARAAHAALAPVLAQGALAYAPTQALAPAPPQRSSRTAVIAAVVGTVVLGVAAALAWSLTQGHDEAARGASAGSSVGPAASKPSQAAPAQPPAPTTPAATTPGGATTPLRIGGMVQSTDTALRDDAQRQFNGDLATRLGACFASAADKRTPGVVVLVDVRAEGTVSSANVIAQLAGAQSQCVADTLKACTFVKRKRASQVTFIVNLTR